MIAIQTKYLKATNTRGSRIKAWVSGRDWSATIPYPHELSYEQAYFAAAKAFVKKYNLDWNTEGMHYGGTEHGYVFCFDSAKVGG
jgi:hypothetical protein